MANKVAAMRVLFDLKDIMFKASLVFFTLVFVWAVICVTGSNIKSSSGNCGKVYPIDSIINTNLFCEKVYKDGK